MRPGLRDRFILKIFFSLLFSCPTFKTSNEETCSIRYVLQGCLYNVKKNLMITQTKPQKATAPRRQNQKKEEPKFSPEPLLITVKPGQEIRLIMEGTGDERFIVRADSPRMSSPGDSPLNTPPSTPPPNRPSIDSRRPSVGSLPSSPPSTPPPNRPSIDRSNSP